MAGPSCLITPLVSEQQWLAKLQGIQSWEPPSKPTVIIAPHPDDETLGAGGLISYQRRRGLSVVVIAVTDGDAAYPDTKDLAKIRIIEQENALGELGVSPDSIIRLGLPDSKVSAHEQQLADFLAIHIQSDTLVVTPWALDWHPDHEACGRAVAQFCLTRTDAEVISYLFWTWHSKPVDCLDSVTLRRFDLDEDLQTAKRAALSHHKSQLYREDGSPVLPEVLLLPAFRPFEVFLT